MGDKVRYMYKYFLINNNLYCYVYAFITTCGTAVMHERFKTHN